MTIAKKFRKSAVVGVSILVQFAFLLNASSQTATTAAGAGGQPQSLAQGQQDWPVYGGSAENNHYSSLSQINRSNVQKLQVAWQFDTGESRSSLETNPLIVDGVLYACTPTLKVIALEAATGKLLWKFDSGIKGSQPSRGLTYWTDGKEKRIFAGVMSFLYALDVKTGEPIPSFGKDGRIDLREDLGRTPVEKQSVWLTTPGIIYKDTIIVGGRTAETLPTPPGDIRAYDVRTGRRRWSFHTIPHPGEFGYETWPKDAWKYSGGVNNWAGMALDVKRGIVYVPTAAGKSWCYGGRRLGDNLFGSSLIALNANTGERIWHFQGVRHDIWDRDFPAHPVLLTVEHNGKKIDAVAQTSKQGFVFLFDRKNGKPLFPIEYRKVLPSDVPGEVAAAEQPIPTKPEPYTPQRLTEDLLTNRTPEAHQWALEHLRQARSEGQFVPLSVGKGTIAIPGFDGGGEWGGAAADPETGVLYVNANEVAAVVKLEENTGEDTSGRGIYLAHCSACHQSNLAGSPPNFPSLVGVGKLLTPPQIAEIIHQGRGGMPGFPNLGPDQVNALVGFLTNGESGEVQGSETPPPPEASPSETAPPDKYRLDYQRFADQDGYPATAPPWGTLNAINLNTGEYVWKIPLGEYPELAAKGLKNTGTENYGGPMVTAGGLVFIGATDFDNKFRAFDKATGELLWEATLPFGGEATPATYEVNGRQFVVIAAGGGRDGKPSGGVYVAFALPQ